MEGAERGHSVTHLSGVTSKCRTLATSQVVQGTGVGRVQHESPDGLWESRGLPEVTVGSYFSCLGLPALPCELRLLVGILSVASDRSTSDVGFTFPHELAQRKSSLSAVKTLTVTSCRHACPG